MAPGSYLLQHAEPVLQMPGMGDSPIFEVMELMKRDGHTSLRWRNAKELSLMSARDLCTYAGAIRAANDLVDRDVEIRERVEEILHDGVQPI